ncbi:elongation factor 2 [Cavenderia fasciculata]|uniref:Elongation factor 2 n=1 Tax=Cavenderia fasciculata TaxID=261658 RepID=F4PMZ3_CACFS|nr:elongation factor 2 [Cavenderia fasciculata]EGG22886.1 elongation factor 2 [Cavenderia fasciculata]|eukprot:XP_004360737.1 elongation factor 2 [Cavenderia fasciculata]
MATQFSINVTNTEFDSFKGDDLLKLVMRRFLGVEECILSMVVTHLPSPIVAQRYRYTHLYKGPLDDAVATAIKNCDPNGPLMVYVSKMILSDGGRLVSFGRVFSGTLSTDQQVRILGSNYEKGSSEDLSVTTIPGTVVIVGPCVEPIADCPCGNIVGITGIDTLKTGTITTSEDAHAMAVVKLNVTPVIRVTVTQKNRGLASSDRRSQSSCQD